MVVVIVLSPKIFILNKAEVLMNSRFLFFLAGLVIAISSNINALAQQRARVVNPTNQQQTKTTEQTSNAVPVPTPQTDSKTSSSSSKKHLTTFAQIRARVTEAQRLFASRPVPTAFSTNTPSIEFVTVAALEPATSKIHLVTIPKKTFLTRNAELKTTSSLDSLLSIRVVRANGVNTAVAIFDEEGKSLTPLIVQYPIERNGKFAEIAYYISIHPALRSPEAVTAGKAYLKNSIDIAIKKLRERGQVISPEIIAIAERLCIIEHADHIRFRTENRAELFDEIYMLLAFNEGNTYRYAVSTAGAGGLVQMIPSTYRMVRQTYPAVGLEPDFVVGMRNHVNAIQAMLLYMQYTWNDLATREDVVLALQNGTAKQSELMSAGYNSNPARLPSYLNRGGNGWRTLIPRETQMYLEIYKAHEMFVPLPKTVVQKPQDASR